MDEHMNSVDEDLVHKYRTEAIRRLRRVKVRTDADGSYTAAASAPPPSAVAASPPPPPPGSTSAAAAAAAAAAANAISSASFSLNPWASSSSAAAADKAQNRKVNGSVHEGSAGGSSDGGGVERISSTISSSGFSLDSMNVLGSAVMGLMDNISSALGTAGPEEQDAILLMEVEALEVFVIMEGQSGAASAEPGSPQLQDPMSRADSGVWNLPRPSPAAVIGPAKRRHIPWELRQQILVDPQVAEAVGLPPNTLFALQPSQSYSLSIAYAQVLIVERRKKAVHIVYNPNVPGSEEEGTAGALRVTFCLPAVKAAEAVLRDIRHFMGRYTQAVAWLERRLPLIDAIAAELITLNSPTGGEVVLARWPAWGCELQLPWQRSQPPTAAPEPSGAESSNAAAMTTAADEGLLTAYLSSPLGMGTAAITPQLLASYSQNDAAHFFVCMQPADTGYRECSVPAGAGQPAQRRSDVSNSVITSTTVDPSSSRRSTAHDNPGIPSTSEPSSSDGAPTSAVSASAASTSSAGNGIASAPTSPAQNRAASHERPPVRENEWRDLRLRLRCSAVYVEDEEGEEEEEHGLGSSSVELDWKGKYLRPAVAYYQSMPPSQQLTATAAALALLALLLQWLLSRGAWLANAAALLSLLALAVAFLGKDGLVSRGGFPGFSALSSGEGDAAAADARVGAQGGGAGWRLTLLGAELIEDRDLPEHGRLETEGGGSEAGEQVRRAAPAIPPEARCFTPDQRERFLQGCNGDRAATKRRMQRSAAWRTKYDVADVLSRPQPFFADAKAMYGHGVLCLTKAGHPVWVDRVGEMKAGWARFKGGRFSEEDAFQHLAFIHEYLWAVTDPSPLPAGRRLQVVDLKGMGLSDMGSEHFEFVKKVAIMTADNYPERLHRCFVVNAPFFFSVLWRVVEPMLTPSTRRKIQIFSTGQEAYAAFQEELDEQDILVEWGGSSTLQLYQSQHEAAMREYVALLNDGDAPPETAAARLAELQAQRRQPEAAEQQLDAGDSPAAAAAAQAAEVTEE